MLPLKFFTLSFQEPIVKASVLGKKQPSSKQLLKSVLCGDLWEMDGFLFVRLFEEYEMTSF